MNEIIMGLKKGFFARMKSDGEGAVTYDAPRRLSELRSASVKPDVQSASADGDDRVVMEITRVNGADLDLEFTRQSSAEYAEILGKKVTDDGTVLSAADDTAPFGAFGYMRTMTNGGFRFVWLLKMMFKETDEDTETQKKGSVNPQYPKLTGTAVTREADSLWRIVKDSDTDISDQWFSKQTLETLHNAAGTIYGKPSEVIFCATLPATGQEAGKVYLQTGGDALTAFYWDGADFQEISHDTPTV